MIMPGLRRSLHNPMVSSRKINRTFARPSDEKDELRKLCPFPSFDWAIKHRTAAS